MSILVKDDAGALRSAAEIKVRDAAIALRNVASVWMRDAAGALKVIWTTFSATVNRTFTTGMAVSSKPTRVYSQSVTVTMVGGVAPFTINWTRTDANPEDWTVSGTDTAQFSTVLAAATDATATFEVTATDASGAVSAGITVTAQCFNEGTP